MQMDPVMAFGVTSFISVLAIINPLSTIGVFMSLTKNDKEEDRNKIAFRSSLAAFAVLYFFALTGFFIFQIYSITVEAFRIAGGAVLVMIGIKMLFPADDRPGRLSASGSQIYLVPLAIPMTAGPGAITTVAVLASQAAGFWFGAVLWTAIFAACAVNFIVLRYSGGINKRMGQDGVAALIKIIGLLVCSVGVQFIINGLKVAFPILG